MASNSLSSLAVAFKAAAPGPVSLNAAFINVNGATAPDNFDTLLTAAFKLEGDGLNITYTAANVGTPVDDKFQIKQAQLSDGFLNAKTDKTSATLSFSIVKDVLLVQIEVAMEDWTLTDYFTSFTGGFFAYLTLVDNTFIFTTQDAAYDWDSNNIALKTGQNLAGNVTVPTQFQPLFNIIGGLTGIPTKSPMFGPIDLSKVNNENVLFPNMSLMAPLGPADQSLTIPENSSFIKAKVPGLGFSTAAVKQKETEGVAVVSGDDETFYAQSVSYFFSALVIITDTQGNDIPLSLKAQLPEDGESFTFTVGGDTQDASKSLTPDTVVSALMGGNSYLGSMPPQLQSFLTQIGFKGLALEGTLKPKFEFTAINIMLGTLGEGNIPLIGDPTNGLDLQLDSFNLTWNILYPLDRELRQTMFLFTTEFEIWPTVFKQINGEPGGVFSVSIDQDVNVTAGFDGKVSFSDLLSKATQGLIELPNGVEVDFSNVDLNISPSTKTYAFGFDVNAEVNFVTWDNNPLIKFQDMRFQLAASTPSNGPGEDGKNLQATQAQTVYKGSIVGSIGVGPIAMNASVKYDGTQTPSQWKLRTALAESLSVSDLINELFYAAFKPPADIIPGDLTVQTFSIDATIPGKASGKSPQGTQPTQTSQSSYQVNGALQWAFDLAGQPIDILAEIGLAFNGNQEGKQGQQFTGSVIGTIKLESIGTEVMIGYRFGPAEDDQAAANKNIALPATTPQQTGEDASSTTLWIQWQGIRADYVVETQTATFSLKGWTIGSLLEALVSMIGNPYFTLSSPWDLLNKISLDGLRLIVSLDKTSTNPLTAEYKFSSPLDLVFIKINSIYFKQIKVAGKSQVTLAFKGSSPLQAINDSQLFDENKGQSVDEMPKVPGRGNAYFDLRLLALGQRIGIYGSDSFNSTQEVIKALENVPSSTDSDNPVNPNSQVKGQPYYNAQNNWMVGMDFGLLETAPKSGVYTIDCMVAFNDPDIYGLRLALNGGKAKILAGLVIDVLYKKITNDIGLYQVDFQLPSALRNLDFGAYAVTLPNIGIKIYTNGDFLIDFGFPYNMDFSRSFTVQAIIAGVPVLGSGGFYFGKLSNATATQLPSTVKGTFDPVIVFGFGAQVGVGRYIDKGIFTAGFSITVFGIIEGVIAPWHPYQLTSAGTGKEVQGDYYFWLQGTFGIIGKLYGTVDFAIIKASVSLTVTLSAQITYESYREIPLVARASVSVHVSVKINLGLFSIRIHFSFSMTISEKLTIGNNKTAPWDSSTKTLMMFRALDGSDVPQGTLAHLQAQQKAYTMPLNFRPVMQSSNTKPGLKISPAAQFTITASDTGLQSEQKGAFVYLFAIDAPNPTDDPAQKKTTSLTSFDHLCQQMLPWLVQSTWSADSNVDSSSVVVKQSELQDLVKRLSNTANPAIQIGEVITFLSTSFDVQMMLGENNKEALQTGAAIFPALPGLSISIPDPEDTTKIITVDFASYATANRTYQQTMAQYFEEVAARVEDEQGTNKPGQQMLAELVQPMVSLVAVDYITLIARQLIQAAADGFSDYPYRLQDEPNTNSLSEIMDWVRLRGNDSTDQPYTYENIAIPNQSLALTAGKLLHITGLLYTVQQNDTLGKISARYSDVGDSPRWITTQAVLITANAITNNLIAANANITLDINGKSSTYLTQRGDTFATIAEAFGINIDALSLESELYQLEGLLSASVPLLIPTIAYTTAGDTEDNLQGIAQRFVTTVSTLVNDDFNQNAPQLFDKTKNPAIKLAGLTSLWLADLWDIIVNAGTVGQTAGMVSRYQMHGMRLPMKSGLSLPSKFLYSKNESAYGVFQLTGQQLPTPPLQEGDAYQASLHKDDTLPWMKFIDSPPGTGPDTGDTSSDTSGGESADTPAATLPLDLDSQAEDLAVVLQYALDKGFNPDPEVDVEAEADKVAKRYSVQSLSIWSSSDMSTLDRVTAASNESNRAQGQPYLWTMPSSLLNKVEQQQAALQNAGMSLKDALKYMPVMAPSIGSTDPATQQIKYTSVDDYSFSTRIDFKIKNLAQASDLEPQTAQANSVVPPNQGNPGAQAQPLSPYNYELIGPGPEDALLLQRLLTGMDTLGEDSVSGIFLLYQDGNKNELVNRGSNEYVSFITQTNLSTETNPPAALKALALLKEEAKTVQGILNSPGEFIKLLWELSTVRSGGYYLYYQLTESGQGLPSSLFDDSGIATLTLVVTYTRQHIQTNSVIAERMSNYVNAFVSTSPVDIDRDVMTLVSESKETISPVLSGSETLDQLAGLYSIGVGTLANLNADADIVLNTEMPIDGAFHLVSQLDMDAGNVLDNLAAYYSKGAQTPITATDIQNYNPGVLVDTFAVFRIPPLVYVVNASTGITNTFRGLSNYFHLSIDSLADLAREASGLFGAVSITIDPQNFDIQPSLATGNIGVNLTRAKLSDPGTINKNSSKDDKQYFAEQTLAQLYSLISAGFYKNAFFNASQQGLSFGPTKHMGSAAQELCRCPSARAKYLAQGAEQDLYYSQVLGVKSSLSTPFAKINTAPNPAQYPDYSHLPDKNANPYIGIGSIAQFHMRWVDLFGNHTYTPFNTPSSDYTGGLNNPPLFMDYIDRPIALDAWPNVKTDYIYAGTASAPLAQIHLSLNTDAYQKPEAPKHPLAEKVEATDKPQWQQNALNDKAVFTSVYFQLNQDYNNAGVEGLSGQAISMFITNSLLIDSEMDLSKLKDDKGRSLAQNVRDFSAACLNYVSARAQGKTVSTAPELTLSIPVDVNNILQQDIVHLQMAFELRRQSVLCDPVLRGIVDGLSTASPIRPLADDNDVLGSTSQTDKDKHGVSLQKFASAMENVFSESAWHYRIGTGPQDPAVSVSTAPHSVWAVRMANTLGTGQVGLGYQINPFASFYAPQPVATSLINRSTKVYSYKSGVPYPDGEARSVSFNGVDLNLWTKDFFTALDTFLSSTYSAPAFILDNLVTPPGKDPEKDGYLAKILTSKKSLADSVGITTKPILTDSNTDELSLSTAQEKVRQQVLMRLSNAYSLSAVAVFSVSDATYTDTTSSSILPSFYGELQGEAGTDNGNTNFSLSTAKINLTDKAAGGNSRLAAVFTSKNVKDFPYVSLGLKFPVTHLAHNIVQVPGIKGYEQTSWIHFITGPINSSIGKPVDKKGYGPAMDFPVVLRALPTPPTVKTQTATSTNGLTYTGIASSVPPVDLAMWNYSFSYSFQRAAQDSMSGTAIFNIDKEKNIRSQESDAQVQLFNALAQFTYVYPDIEADLETYLRKVDGKSKSTDDTVVKAANAVAALQTLVNNVAVAYAAWAKPAPLLAQLSTQGTQPVEHKFELVLVHLNNEAILHVLDGGTTPPGVTVPVPQVYIDPTHYKPEIVQPDVEEDDVQVSYRYVLKEGVNDPKLPNPMSYKYASQHSDRTVTFPGLNVFNYQNAWSSIQGRRNEFLVPEKTTTDDFIFKTPVAKFADPITPLLRYSSYNLGELNPQSHSLDDYLTSFYNNLFSESVGQQVEVKMESAYSYQLSPAYVVTTTGGGDTQLPRPEVPISLMTPSPLTLNGGAPGFVSAIAQVVDNWWQKQAPSLMESSQFNFEIEVFSSQDQTTSKPLFSIDNAHIDVNKVEKK